ncbi:MAG: hypothetical protein IPL26_15825 [Leptospiraceae bacterium]|nr:hypothetical protein [Leptospiraceae bacterium]
MKVLFLLFLFFSSKVILPIEPVILPEEVGEYPLGLYLEILEDKEGKLTIDDIQKPELENLWMKSKSDVPSFGFSKSIYWVRFQLATKSEKEYYLEIDYPLLYSSNLHPTSPIILSHKLKD